MSEKKMYYFELSEVVRHVTEVIADAARLERESMNNSASLIAWYAKGVEKGETALGISSFAEQIREKEVRVQAFQNAALIITESLADQAEELQQRCREQRAAEAANDCDQELVEIDVADEETVTLALDDWIKLKQTWLDAQKYKDSDDG